MLPLDADLISKLNLGPTQQVEVGSQGQSLLVAPNKHQLDAVISQLKSMISEVDVTPSQPDIEYAAPDEVAAARKEIHERYHEVFRKLAQ